MSYRDTASYGKRIEYVAIAELLRRDYDVYLTLVDDQGIDCILRREIEGKPIYIDIQIKARSKKASHARFTNLDIPNPRLNYLFMFYSESLDLFWIVPSTDIGTKVGWRLKKGTHKGKYAVNLSGTNKGKQKKKEEFNIYEGDNGFIILDNVFNNLSK